MTLDKWLAQTILFVKDAVKTMPDHDIETTFIILQANGSIYVAVPEWNNSKEKQDAFVSFRNHLQKVGATHYSVISTNWIINLNEQANRAEVFLVNVGDRQQSKTAILEIKRNKNGRITDLVEKDVIDEQLSSSVTNLLVSQTIH